MTALLAARWPHQEYADTAIPIAFDTYDRVVVTSPTGGGKSRIMTDRIEDWSGQSKKSVLYTNRKMLIDQLDETLADAGIEHGVRASNWPDQRWLPVQLSIIQTEMARRGTWELHPADYVIIDECHLHTGPKIMEIIDEHRRQGAKILGVTATPIGLGGFYDHLIVAGTNSELRACGALVPADCFGPDEPDTKRMKKKYLWEMTENDVRKLMNVKAIFARVLDWWNRLNPDGKATILFAPGVEESIWFAEGFHKAGISAAHIDGEDCWIDGKLYKSSISARKDIMQASREGRVRIVCNRFVLREGINAPWLAHGILATVFSSLQSYLQSIGRLLRSYPGLDRVTVQDHGGNWWRHGSPNSDRQWDLSMGENVMQSTREEKLRNKQLVEPVRCPQCARILAGRFCPCGFEITKKSRPVVQESGELREMHGDIFRPRVVREYPNTQQLWDNQYFRARNSKKGMTFKQAEALFFLDHHYWPPHTLKRQPTDFADWFKLVRDLGQERLRT